jgi:hypothetical protein
VGAAGHAAADGSAADDAFLLAAAPIVFVSFLSIH